MPPERLEIGPEAQSEMNELVSRYKGIFEQSQREVDRLTQADTRTQLQDFLSKNEFQIPREQEELMQNEQEMRMMLALGLAEQQLKPIREQILQKIDKEVAEATTETNRYLILRKHFEFLSNQENGDIILMQDMLSRIIQTEAGGLSEEYKKPNLAPIVDSGKNWILNGGDKPSEFNERPVPQLIMFSSFRMNVLFQEKFQNLRIQLGNEVNSVEDFTKETMPLYQEFLKENNVDVASFCPDEAFYKKLCEKTGINAELLTSIDTSHALEAAGFSEFSATQGQNEARFEERRDHHERAKERIEAQVTQLETQMAAAKEDGNTERENEVKLEIAALQTQARTHAEHQELFTNMIKGSEDLTSRFERQYMATEGARAVVPSGDYLGELAGTDGIIGGARGLIGKGFAATSRGMDWVGRLVPDTGDPMSWNAGGMMQGAVKVGLAAGGIISLIKVLAPTYVGLQNFATTAINPFKWGKIPEKLRGIKSGLRDSIGNIDVGGIATIGLATGAVLLTKEQIGAGLTYLKNLGGGVARRLANNEYAPEVGHKIRDAAAYIAEHGPDGLRKYLWDPAVHGLSKVKEWSGEAWDAMKELGRAVNVNVEEYQNFYLSMDRVETHLSNQFQNISHLKGLGMSIDIASVSSVSFAKMCQSYSARNKNHDQTKGTLPLTLEELADAGFIYKNGDRVTKDQLTANGDYTSLSEEQRVVNVSAELSTQLISQADFWLRYNPEESKP